jgi:glycerol-3-phosphate O-acyltransferase
MLSYYRNMMVHVFLPEALVGFAHSSFGSQMAFKDGVPVERLVEETLFLANILQNEFIMAKPIRNEQDVLSTLAYLQEKRILTQKEGKIFVDQKGERILNFYTSFLRPLACAYWATIGQLLTMKHNQERVAETNLEKFEEYVQWFTESLYTDKTIDHYEACSLETLKNSIKTYETMQIISIREYPREKRVEILANE